MAATARKTAVRKPATVANRKTKRKHHKKRNGAPSASTAIAVRKPTTVTKYVTRNPVATVANKRRHHKKRRNGSTSILSRMNPFGSQGLGGLKPTDLVGGAVGIFIDGALQMVVPASWIGILLRYGGAIAMAKFLPKSLAPAAALAAGAVVTKDGVNRLFNLSALINSGVARIVPVSMLAATPAVGMGGFRGMDPRRVTFGPRAGRLY